MRLNIEDNLANCNIYRLLVEFSEKSKSSIKDQLIPGRASHILYLCPRILSLTLYWLIKSSLYEISINEDQNF